MKERNIFNSSLELDCFCLDIAEAWIKYRTNNDLRASYNKFEEWVSNELCPALEYNFNDVYESEFGESALEYDDDDE